MLHGTNPTGHGLARAARLARTAAASALAGLLLPLAAPALAGTAHAVPAAHQPDMVSLVRAADGTLEVVTGQVFAGAVVAQEQEVTFSTAVLDSADLDLATGLVSDAYRSEQWNLDAIQAETVWTRGTGEGEVIAIIDSGVDGAHPDLAPRLVAGYSATGADELVDGHGHGTHVAGIAAATAGDAYGIAGLAHDAAIMPIQVTDDRGVAYSSDVAEGLLWAVEHGATVANLSLAGPHRSTVLAAAIDHAVEQGVVVVAAAGNEGNRNNPTMYPAAEQNVLAVASLGDGGDRSSFSSTGAHVDLAAPGSAILSNRPGARVGYASGTSMAAPFVAAAVAIVRSAGDVDGHAAVEALLDTAEDRGDRGHDAEFGAGALNLLAALDVVAPAPELEVRDDLVGEAVGLEMELRDEASAETTARAWRGATTTITAGR